jgi:DUF971 family protein
MGILDDLKPQAKRPTPLEINASKSELLLAWSDGQKSRFPFRFLRERCPCAGCVDEWTGRRTVNADTIPADIRPLELTPVGRYAIQVAWSDGHTTGIYSWDLLRKLEAEAP